MKILKFFLILFILNCNFSFSQIDFYPYINISTGSWPEVVAIDDINNDGLNDVILGTRSYGESPNDFKIMVFIQNTDATLNTPILYSYNSEFSGIKTIDIVDINNDNLKDVIIGFDNNIGIFYQNSSNTLNPILEFNTNIYINSLKVKDLNYDGFKDIVIGTHGNFFKIYYQTTLNNFNDILYSKPSNSFDEVEIADINNDFKLDLIFITKFSNSFYVYYQNSTNNYNLHTTYTCSSSINSFSIGDLNNDGRNDLAITRSQNYPNSKVFVFYQNSSTNLLDNPIELQAYDVPQTIEISDLNNDGLNEIIALHGGWLKLSIFETNGTTFNPYLLFDIPYASSYNNQGMDIGDINNDGAKDIAIADYNNGLVILYNLSSLSNNTFGDEFITVYPNPVYESFRINSNSLQKTQYEIFDINGKILTSGVIENPNLINICHFEKGFYFVKIKTEKSTKTFKIIKL